ncbi:restriction endonuclease-like protein [Bacillus sp. FJAT-29953]|nr:restriction endonuclease-like protein [Bacillus sp. FJAT-29953]
MVTPCRTDDFTVSFIHVYGNGSQEEKILSCFVENLEDWDEKLNSYLEIREFVELEIMFQSEHEDARLFMDGLEVLTGESLPRDETTGEPYIQAGQRVTLYKSPGYYPYIPGIYCVKVVFSNKTYLSLVKVITNRLTDEQLNVMRIGVEGFLKGLAHDVVRKQKAFYHMDDDILDPTLLQQFRVLDHHFAEISAILADLSQRVRFSLMKEYQLQPVDRPAQVDDVSIRYRLRHPESTNYVKSPKKRVNYNLPENRILKTIIEKWLRLLRNFIEAVDRNLERLTSGTTKAFSSYIPYEKRVQYVEELRGYRDRAAQMKGAFTILKTSRWYQELSNGRVQMIPTMMYVDVRYRFIWQMDRILFSEETDITLHPDWRYHWKRTDHLYEIWCYLKVLQTLESSRYGFSYSSGWLFDHRDFGGADFFVIPTIPKSTTVKLTKDDLRLSVIYDAIIPSNQADTNQLDSPIYTTAENNNPDIRIDVYIQDIFVGTILLESKYRNKNAILGSEVMRQLTSYADNVRSPYIFNKKRRWEKFRPVHQVLVLYPEKWGETDVKAKEGRSISLIPLTPATDLDVFNQTIENLIEDLILEAEDEGIVTETVLLKQ